MSETAIPRAVLIYGLLGILPFLLPLAGLREPGLVAPLAGIALIYGALILSFLGGARWGLAVAQVRPAFATVSLAMLPTIMALAVLVLLHGLLFWQLLAMAGLLVLHLGWDLASAGLPGWYPQLRILLTSGAVIGLVAGALLLPG